MTAGPARIDAVRGLTFRGLSPSRATTVSVTTTRGADTWVSLGTFTADQNGVVDTGQMPSIAGTYVGRSAMGLFWSQRCTNGAAVPSTAGEPVASTVHVRQHGEIVEVTAVRRVAHGPDVERRPAAKGLVGTVYLPVRPRRIPVLVLGGSEGGQNDLAAALMAAHGHPSMALTYFGTASLRDRIEEVPLDYLAAAAEDLAGTGPFAVYGVSKGGELALVLGATHPAVAGVAVMVPSLPGVSALHSDLQPWSGRGAPRGMPMGHVEPPRPGELFAPGTAFRTARDRGPRITGPTLLVTAGHDTVLPPLRLEDPAGKLLERVHIEGAGHLIQPPFLPTTATVAPYGDGWLLLGGNPARNAVANRIAWTRTLRFLRLLDCQ
ncbi:acyl-CoA thioesterase/bile acid-CoA:amino acid N-acyltransferase family protein [Actinomadura sp. WMMA1423]|uniref:acyl-CoA thioesterase/bile acid-CoA:amino acid N-acyltransferase family protein n=1 Tax=Actinomadura sp. WMMA1423 TaxID=2591108 RepID=UPI001147807C|nr:acyl-CoA thioesterase/bile acid-CoA:amino acid N-acyltransferase family protein [Actinomadura sp. WMMA1423]